MANKPTSKRPRPSYEDGELRDLSIEEMQQPLGEEELKRLIERAIGRKPSKEDVP